MIVYCEENFSSSFLIEAINGTAGSSCGSWQSVSMRLEFTIGKLGLWNGPALNGLEPQLLRDGTKCPFSAILSLSIVLYFSNNDVRGRVCISVNGEDTGLKKYKNIIII